VNVRGGKGFQVQRQATAGRLIKDARDSSGRIREPLGGLRAVGRARGRYSARNRVSRRSCVHSVGLLRVVEAGRYRRRTVALRGIGRWTGATNRRRFESHFCGSLAETRSNRQGLSASAVIPGRPLEVRHGPLARDGRVPWAVSARLRVQSHRRGQTERSAVESRMANPLGESTARVPQGAFASEAPENYRFPRSLTASLRPVLG
jgi:hypothetical protein